jgi:prepilin-type N-terminal cleavage/methylation domain-containing protein
MPSLCSCILLCLLAVVGFAGESVSVAVAPDLRETLAATTLERDALRQQTERLQQQRTVLIVVAGLLAVAVGFLVRAKLLSGRTPNATSANAQLAAQEDGSDPFPEPAPDLVTATTVTMRKKNATITIRNGATQREVVSGQVQTRRFFSGDTRKVARRESADETPHELPSTAQPTTDVITKVTNRTTKRTTTPATALTPSPALELSPEDAAEADLRPSTDRVVASAGAATSQEGPRRPVTVRVDHQSDRLDVVEVTVKPGTTGVFRRQAFTLLEVMISLALLATVLSAVISSIYTLHRTRVMAQEDAESQALGRVFVERIMAESWNNLHDGVPGRLWKANYVDDVAAIPLTAEALRAARVVDELPALNDLKVYIEYYPQSALENAIRDQVPMVLTNRLGGRERTMVFRIVIQWQGYDGGTRRHVQLFARSE